MFSSGFLPGSSFDRSWILSPGGRRRRTSCWPTPLLPARKLLSARGDADKERAEIGSERDQLLAEARKSAQLETVNLHAQSTQEIAKLHGEAEAAIARERVAAEQAIIARASELSLEIAQRLLGRLSSKITLSAFLDGLCQELRALSSEERESFTLVTMADHAIEVVTAAPLSKGEMEHVRDALKGGRSVRNRHLNFALIRP